MCLTRSFVASCFARAATSIPSMSEQVTRVARLATELAEQLSSILLSATRACSHLRWVESCSTFGLRGKRRASMIVVTIAMPHTVPPWRPTFCLGVSNRSMTGREHSLHGTRTLSLWGMAILCTIRKHPLYQKCPMRGTMALPLWNEGVVSILLPMPPRHSLFFPRANAENATSRFVTSQRLLKA